MMKKCRCRHIEKCQIIDVRAGILDPSLLCANGDPRMATNPENLLPTAGDFMKKLALAEAEEASKQARQIAEAEAEKKALLDQLTKPTGISDEEAIQRAIKIIERAGANGKTE